MITQIKLIAGAVIIAVLIGLGFWGYHNIYQTGKAAGAAEVQTAWDADKAAIQKATDAAIAQATAQRDMALQANEVIHAQYANELAAAAATGLQLAQRLRDAESRAATDRGPVSKTDRGPRPSAAGEASSMGAINEALGSVLTECADNRAQLNALIGEIKPQL